MARSFAQRVSCQSNPCTTAWKSSDTNLVFSETDCFALSPAECSRAPRCWGRFSKTGLRLP
eukprot:3234910-Alexandrium_andersonii.AAC.1